MREFIYRRIIQKVPARLKTWYWAVATQRWPILDVGYRPGFGHFWWPVEIVEYLHATIGSQSVRELRSMPDSEGVIAYHHSSGRWIRNQFGLWRKRCPYSVLDDVNHERFPDQLSHAILRALWLVVVQGKIAEVACDEVGLPRKPE